MAPMYISINQIATGRHLKQLLKDNGFSVKDIQKVMGFTNPGSVYKWFHGQTLPSVDNLVILSMLLNISMNDLLVFDDGDIFCSERLHFLLLNR